MSFSTLAPGDRIGKYRIVAHIATGGMGTVYKARDETLSRLVALKVLAPELADNPILVERFRREAVHAARLTHKNIVTLYEHGQSDGQNYLAMEFIDGLDLSEYILRKGQLDPETARAIVVQACRALRHAYSHGITHRDIKPSNFLLANDEGRMRVKLTDLGLARMENEKDFRVTRAGTTVGTVDYMAPEQARDSSLADVRSDIYSLGCTFYHMLAGQPPFVEGGLGQRIYQHFASEPADVRTFNPQVSEGLWAVLRRMLAKNPDDRFQTPTEVIQALRSLGPARGPDSDLDPEADLPHAAAAPPNPALARAEPEFGAGQHDMPAARVTPLPVTPVPEPPGSPPPREREPTPRPTKRPSTLPSLPAVPEAGPDPLGVTPDQRSNAAAQYAHATEVLRGGGDPAYALQLLLLSCKLDPANILYRKMLREVGRDVNGGKRGWFGSLANLPARGRLRAARAAGDHRKALEHGEDLLCRLPGDASAQIDMADSAQELGLSALAAWLLEEARSQAPKDRAILHALAHLYEKQKRFPQAVGVWEQIRQADPTDAEAAGMIKNLAARDTIARSKFRP
jgi:serine/threonine protein kinase